MKRTRSTTASSEQLANLRHSLAHLLAKAVLELYPGAHNAIGPSIEHGFYQDFDLGETKITAADLPKIEKKMRQILPTWKSFSFQDVSLAEAEKLFANNPYKLELARDFAKEGKQLQTNNPGNFLDLCKMGHVENPSAELTHFKLLSVAGAYWRGDEKKKMLTRIYGTGFPTQEELDTYIAMRAEAEKRDHRKLGQELDLYLLSDLVGKGLPLFTPRGTMLRELLNDFSQELRAKKGWQKVWSPHITKNVLYKTSGHWDKFGDELFLVKSQETSDELVMKPMNCPHHQQIYAARPRSYRDLPIKYMETTTDYRDEKAGELLGLSRVRCLTQDDSHTFCQPQQIEDIFGQLIDATMEFYNTLGMKLRARLSFRDPQSPDKYLGEPALWQQAQDIILHIAKKTKLDYFVAEGEAAFYGPKIDFMATDALGREWQLATPQLDFVQPKRFGLTYTDEHGKDQTPVMIHYAMMGSIERFLSVYVEHTAGNFPVWLAPTQVQLLPVGETHVQVCHTLANEMRELGIRAEVDAANESVGYKIRRASQMKVPYLLVIGDKEMKSPRWQVKLRGQKEPVKITKKKFLAAVVEEIISRKDGLLISNPGEK